MRLLLFRASLFIVNFSWISPAAATRALRAACTELKGPAVKILVLEALTTHPRLGARATSGSLSAEEKGICKHLLPEVLSKLASLGKVHGDPVCPNVFVEQIRTVCRTYVLGLSEPDRKELISRGRDKAMVLTLCRVFLGGSIFERYEERITDSLHLLYEEKEAAPSSVRCSACMKIELK